MNQPITSEDILAQINDKLTTLTSDMSTIKTTIATRDDLLTTLNFDMSTIKATMATRDDLLTTLNFDMSTIKATMATRDDLAGVKERLQELSGEFKALRATDVAIDHRTKTLEGYLKVFVVTLIGGLFSILGKLFIFGG